jgi:polyferredoxin
MALSLVAFWRRKKGLRVVSLLLSLGIVGFYLNGSLSVVHLVNVINLRFPPFPAHASWYLLLLFGVVTALMVGRIYCGWLCPFGALQEFLKKLVPYRLRLSPAVHRTASRLRVLLLWLVICLVILSGSQEMLRYEPFAMAFSLRGTYLMWASLILILAASLVIDRLWCRYFCVVGMALHLLGKLGLRRKRRARSESAEMVGDF